MNRRILFLSNMYPSETQSYYDELGYVRGGENITFIQQSLIDGFYANGCEVFSVNKLLATHKDKRVIPFSAYENGLNFKYIRVPVLSSNLVYYWAKKHLKQCRDYDIVVAYGFTNYNLQALRYFKKQGMKTALIVPDLPEYTKKSSNSPLVSMKNRLADGITYHCYRKAKTFIDLFLLFSEKMKNRLDCEKNYLVMESIATDLFSSVAPERLSDDDRIKYVFYGGGLHQKYGAKLLMDAFDKMESPNVHLILCGAGDYDGEIRKAAENDGRIHYLGRVPRSRFLSLAKGSDVLVNPRPSCEAFSEYSFPSKNMEYLSSGIPMVGFRLGGIPDEYDSYINYPAEETPESLAETILSVLNNEDDIVKARNAQQFVLTQKNKTVLANRILNYFGSIGCMM